MILNSKLQVVIKTVLILWFVIAMYLQRNTGLADNGDFTRSIGWISSGPIGIEPNWPSAGDTDGLTKRFFNYWLPFWKFDLNLQWPTNSAFLLWLPGILLNYVFYSNHIIYLPILSFFPKLILFCTLLLLLNWIKSNPSHRSMLFLSIGAPVIFIFTNTEYAAYFNSFYQESASFIFLVLFLISILFLKRHLRFVYVFFSLGLLLLLTTAKSSNIYWPIVGIPLVLYIWSGKKDLRVPIMAVACPVLIFLFIFASMMMTKAAATQVNPYHSLFLGVLSFSDDPSARLQDLDMEGATQCINTTAFSSIGTNCLAKYQDKMSFKNTARVIFKEPVVIVKVLKYALDNMQDISLDYLGKYSLDDPRSRTLPNLLNVAVQQERYQSPVSESILLDLWARIKYKFFPIGYSLAFTLFGFLFWFMWRIKSIGMQQDLAIMGLMSTVACIASALIAILGDGKSELIKHLFLSNFLFDIAFVAFLNSVLLYSIEFYENRSLKL